ncbi:hypothetical protein HNP84_002527 [Thermocatellispora tengchongensis]|uniref:CopC domain-containing protein n=1 Tax=Thermocatellispora tengchongensis TaxID=1073253 RepID=A0A840P2T0_9ACTN|nr:copper resistance CopC family protein [Thermocatellispora tengchongensis]MBB5132806.1 hypothetical protein [Thermocatellispora tengchongensis]
MKTSPLGAALWLPLAVIAVLLGLAAPALAHDALKRSDPAKNAEVESVREVTLEFTGKVRLPTVLVTGADGSRHHSGEAEVEGTVVTQAVTGPLPPGKYTIAYRVVSSDGHPIEGEIPFTVVGGASASPTPAAAESTPESTPATSPAETATTPAPAAPATQVAATREEAGGGGIPAWLWIAVGGLAGIGIGMYFSLRPKKRP